MKTTDFDFDLPEDRIALRPARPRSSSRLLVADGDALHDSIAARLGDVVVVSDDNPRTEDPASIRAAVTA